MTEKKNPAMLLSSDKVNPTQRKSLGLGTYVPRIRDENEAMPITFNSSGLIPIPKMESIRAGSNDFLTIKRIGVNC